jgi:hypothetical protein
MASPYALSFSLRGAVLSIVWWSIAIPTWAYDATKLTLTPSSANDSPAQQIQKAPKDESSETESELVEKVKLPRNDKLQRFEFEAEGKFTERDIKKWQLDKKMPVQVDFVDVRTDRAGIALGILFGGGGGTPKIVAMSSYEGEVPLSSDAKPGDTWKMTGFFQIGCTADGKVFGSTGSKINRLSGTVQFRGDRIFPVPRIECEAAPNPAAK